MISLLRSRLFAAVALCSAFGGFNAAKADIFTACGIDLGRAGRTKSWALFSVGGDATVADMNGNSYIRGDVGVAGNGNINASGGATIYGDLYYHTGGSFSTSGHAGVTGTIHHDAASDALLDQAVIDAQNASAAAFALQVSPPYAGLTSIDLSGHNMTMLAAAGTCTVLRLTDFRMSGGSVLTLVGTTAQAFIINITGRFSLSGGSRIVLSGGLTWDSVLFNIRGTGRGPELSGGSNIMSGIILATQRRITISGGSIVNGMVIANGATVSGGSAIVRPVTPNQNP